MVTPAISSNNRSRSRDVPIAGLRILGQKRLVLFRKVFKNKSRITIGRTRQREVRFRDVESISRLHATITRTDDGQYVIADRSSTNGVYVAPRGKYSVYRKVESETLQFGMIIRLGKIVMTPVDGQGNCPILAARQSQLIRDADVIYGSPEEAGKHIGVSRKMIAKFFARLGRKKS